MYGEDDALQNISAPHTAKELVDIPSEAPTMHPCLFICIPACPKPTEYGSEDQDHATIKEVPLDQLQEDETKSVSNIPDFPKGTTCSKRQCGKIQALLASEELDDTIIMSPNISGEPTNIRNVLNLPGKEGEAWEHMCQSEWQNMLDHNVFSPPEESPPNMQILKMGMTLQMKKKDGKITNQKVHIVTKGYSQVPGLHFKLPLCNGNHSGLS